MSRSQSTSTYNTATDDSTQQQQQSADAVTKAQGAIDDYSSSLSKYAADNPYGAGGAYQEDQNQSLSDTASGTAAAAGNALQQQAQRTGENASGSIAATEAMQDQNERTLAGQQAEANADRIGKGATYGQSVLSAGTVPISAEESLASTEGGLAANNLSTASGAAAANKSFWDQFGGAFATGLGNVLSGNKGAAGSGGGGAAALFGG